LISTSTNPRGGRASSRRPPVSASLQDIQQPLVRADLELLARLLVDVRGTQHGSNGFAPSNAGSVRHPSAGFSGPFHDLGRGTVQQPMIVPFNRMRIFSFTIAP